MVEEEESVLREENAREMIKRSNETMKERRGLKGLTYTKKRKRQ